MRIYSYHGLPKWLQVYTFYNGLGGSTKTLVDAAIRGALIEKMINEAYDLLEEMAVNIYQWLIKRLTSRKSLRVHEVDNITTLIAQLTILTKKPEAMIANAIHIPHVVYELYNGNYPSTECQVGNSFASLSLKQV